MNAWKTYFWFILIVTALFIFYVFSLNLGFFPSISEDIDLKLDSKGWYSVVFSVVILLPLFGISYNKRISKVLIWKFVFIVQICDFLWEYFDIKSELIAEPLSPYSISVILFFLVFVVPMVIANYIYAFKSEAIWQLQVNT